MTQKKASKIAGVPQPTISKQENIRDTQVGNANNVHEKKVSEITGVPQPTISDHVKRARKSQVGNIISNIEPDNANIVHDQRAKIDKPAKEQISARVLDFVIALVVATVFSVVGYVVLNHYLGESYPSNVYVIAFLLCLLFAFLGLRLRSRSIRR
jgi:predicted XRE-type DNA-binding protein